MNLFIETPTTKITLVVKELVFIDDSNPIFPKKEGFRIIENPSSFLFGELVSEIGTHLVFANPRFLLVQIQDSNNAKIIARSSSIFELITHLSTI
jgi:hypothetical protein